MDPGRGLEEEGGSRPATRQTTTAAPCWFAGDRRRGRDQGRKVLREAGLVQAAGEVGDEGTEESRVAWDHVGSGLRRRLASGGGLDRGAVLCSRRSRAAAGRGLDGSGRGKPVPDGGELNWSLGRHP